MLNKVKIIRYFILYFCTLSTFFLSGIIINILQCILYLTLRPLSKYFYRKINYYLCYSLFCQMICVAEWYANAEIDLYIDKNDLNTYFGKEHALIVINHAYEVDWLFVGIFCDKVHCAGNFKAYIKKIIQYLPTLGWCLFFAENIFLERSFEKDKDTIQKQIGEIVDHPDPVWITLFPEGTRFTQQKYEQSLQFAKEKGLPELKHHLSPRPKGFLTSLPPLRQKIGAIYDITLSFNPKDDVNPTVLNVALGHKVKASFYIRRIPMNQVPKEEKEATDFLNDIFINKDKLQDSYFKTGHYFEDSSITKYEPIRLKKNYLTLANSLMWYILILVPIWYNLVKTVFYASFFTKCVVFVSVVLFFVLISKALSITSYKKGRR